MIPPLLSPPQWSSSITPTVHIPAVVSGGSHECHRNSCRDRVARVNSYCSQTCRKIDTSFRGLPHAASAGSMTVGPETAVAHAFSWMDARCAKQEAS